ncbi:DNA cytosine methyltransferase [Streptomyces sp. NPDC048441]|uniref:DNA cytosine methyltransferase n=1 Tax=Streptomyces sp. NPDC048441 TaxID=3365552 RepID=UPI00371469FA
MTRAPQQQPPRPANPVIVDLFAGPGGLDIAAEVLGVASIGVEWDPPTRATRDAAGLASTTIGNVAELSPLDEEVQNATVLTGGPPCQTFSVAGNREGHKALDDVKRLATRIGDCRSAEKFDLVWEEVRAETDNMSDERTGLVLQPLRWIVEKKLKTASPYQVVVLEQVPTVRPVWEEYAKILRGLGYAARCEVLHTEDFGVPQTRRRAVLIARYAPEAVDREIKFPAATHQRYRKGAQRLSSSQKRREQQEQEQQDLIFSTPEPEKPVPEPWVSMRDALKHHRPAEFVVVSNYGSGGDPKKRGRRTSAEPSATITGKFRRNKLFERVGSSKSGEEVLGAELGRLSFEEGGLLQTFPARYPWRSTDVAQQIGNAIPPRLSLHILGAALGLGEPGKDVLERLRDWCPPPRSADGSGLRSLELPSPVLVRPRTSLQSGRPTQ